MFVGGYREISHFDNATTTGASLKALLWIVLSVAAFHVFLDSFRKNKWPL